MAQDKHSSRFDDPIPLSDDERKPTPIGQEEEPIPLSGSEDEAIGVVSESEVRDSVIASGDPSDTHSAVRAIKTSLDIGKRTKFKRTPINTGTGAVRCRMFHCKVAESSMEHMENQINMWLDDEEIDVKHIGHMVGLLEGKHTEPNIVVMIWY